MTNNKPLLDPGYDLSGGSYEYIGPWEKWRDWFGHVHFVDEGFWEGGETLMCHRCNYLYLVEEWVWVDDVRDYCPLVKAIPLEDFALRLAGIYNEAHAN